MRRWILRFFTPSALALTAACAAQEGSRGDAGGVLDGPSGACVSGLSSAQFRAQVAPPNQLRPSERASVSVSFLNCSGARWRPGEYELVPRPGSDVVWGVAHVELPREVADGELVTIPFEVQAPSEAGSYEFSWALSRGSAELLQEPSPAVTVEVRSAASCAVPGPVARFRRDEPPPAFVGVGETVRATLTFANCGAEPWTREAGFALVSAAPTATAPWGTTRIELPDSVAPGAEVTIPVATAAPDAAGRYPFTWTLAQSGAPLGEASPARQVSVNQRFDCGSSGSPARFVGQRVPSTLDALENSRVELTFANCSSDLWGAGWSLAPTSVEIAHAWNVSSAPLPYALAPGFSAPVSFDIHAPDSGGSYGFRFAVRSPTGESLVESSPQTSIMVREPDRPVCGALQWWNAGINANYRNGGWWDTDLNVRSGTPVQLRHRSRLERFSPATSSGDVPTFTDLETGYVFRFFHLKPGHTNTTVPGTIYPAGTIVGLSGGDTWDTGLCVPSGCTPVICHGPDAQCVHSTGAHLCVQTYAGFAAAFPSGNDACR